MGAKKEDFDWHAYMARRAQDHNRPSLESFYHSQQFPSDLVVDQADFVALDFETTGLNAKEDEIISIGLVPFTMNRIKVAQAGHWLIRPNQSLNDESIVIHGITHSEVSNAPDFLDVIDEVLSHLEGKIVVVHFRYIEREFLYESIQSRLNTELLFPVIDTMAIEAMRHRSGWRSFAKRVLGQPQPSIRLADSRLRYGLPRYHLHSAVTDAIATAELFQAQIRHLYHGDTRVSALWL